MPKVLALVKRAAGIERDAFASEYLAFGRDLARDHSFSHCTINLVDIPPEEAGLRLGGEPTFDAVAELWGDDPRGMAAALQAAPGISACHAYSVEEKVERDYSRDWQPGERSPGVKSFFLARRHPEMSHDEFAAYWGGQHAPLALRIHIGMWRYTRNVVTEPLTADAPGWDGMAILHFHSSFDLRERFYDSDAGRAAIAADIARFSGGGRALHSSEWVLS